MKLTLDIFCHVVDYYGDAGYALRFCRSFQQNFDKLFTLRLFCDQLTLLKWLDPKIEEWLDVYSWDSLPRDYDPAELLVEILGGGYPNWLIQLNIRNSQWISLEHFTLEHFVQELHLTCSLLENDRTRTFFFPGIEAGGGVMHLAYDKNKDWLGEDTLKKRKYIQEKYSTHITQNIDGLMGLVYVYDLDFSWIFEAIEKFGEPIFLFIFGDHLQAIALAAKLSLLNNCHIIVMPNIPQNDFDELCYLMDFLIVRGEDSFAQAILTGKPWLWQSYPQEKKFVQQKVVAVLEKIRHLSDDSLEVAGWAECMMILNGLAAGEKERNPARKFFWFLESLGKIGIYMQKLQHEALKSKDLTVNFVEFFADKKEIKK